MDGWIGLDTINSASVYIKTYLFFNIIHDLFLSDLISPKHVDAPPKHILFKYLPRKLMYLPPQTDMTMEKKQPFEDVFRNRIKH